MKKLKIELKKYLTLTFSFFVLFNYYNLSYSNEIEILINGNEYTDSNAITSLLKEKPKEISDKYSNYIIKTLDNSNLFEDVQVTIQENKYIISIKEYPNLKKIFYKNNERIKDEEFNLIVEEIELTNLNPFFIELFINQVQNIYESFGYNNIKIDFYETIDSISNTAELTFKFDEGSITKINSINFNGNNKFDSETLRSIIKSKTKSIKNIFANNNYKKYIVENDTSIISNFYKNNGYIDIQVNFNIEYLSNNKVNIYFNINEGEIYFFDKITFIDNNNLLDELIIEEINKILSESIFENNIFSIEKINQLRKQITDYILDNNISFFEIKSSNKIQNQNISIFFEILPITPKYTNQINIIGNTRTYDYVIRREIDLSEGDALYENQIENIRNKLLSLDLFKSVTVSKELIDDNLMDINISVEEKQTGTFNAGVSVGTLDGFSILGGLKERNFYGTGRSLEVLLNTSETRRTLKFETKNRFSYIDDSTISYNINFNESDLSQSASYKLNSFQTGIGLGYKINNELFHNINLDYAIKEYIVTDSSTVSSSIADTAGESVSFLLKNNFRYSSLNTGFIPKYGNYLNYNNTIETPTSSNNGFIRNIITYKKYNNFDKNILSLQGKIGNIFSLNNDDILTDDKFSLGGRWLRGFDNFGAGPRNSRTSYVGGNNIIAVKFDYSREIIENTNFPIYLNIFNDYGLLWENKTDPIQNDNSLRSSLGFGVKYYSPIGPIGFSWGYPLIDEDYDIKRMFLFSIGNID